MSLSRCAAALFAAATLGAAVAAPPVGAAAPERIVALTPFTANTLADLGVKPVAVGMTLGGHERFSRKLRGIKRLPLAHPTGPNMEQLAQLNPQLVFSSPTWRKGSSTMRSFEIQVEESDPYTVHDVPARTRTIGRLVGREAEARKLADSHTRKIKRATRRIRKRPRVLMILGVGRAPFAFLANSWGGDLVRRAGGRLITGGLKSSGGFARISNEAVIANDPDVIIAVPHANPSDIPELTRYLKSNPAWESTSAARKNRIYVSTDNSLLQSATDVARVIRNVRTRYLKNR